MSTRPSRTIITGGTGFIGSYLALDLLRTTPNEEIILFDRDPDLRRITKHDDYIKNPKWGERLTFVHGDLTKAEQVYALFDQHQPHTVFHLGALLSAGAETNPTMGYDVDLLGSRHVLEAARLVRESYGHDPVKVIFPSTIASFGDHLTPPFDRNNVPNEATQMPTTVYGIAKVSVERLGEYYYRQRAKTLDGQPWVDFRGVRFPSVIGATRGPGGTTAYSTLMCDLPLRGIPYDAYIAPDVRIALLYVKDAVKALRAVRDAKDSDLGSSDVPAGTKPADIPVRRVFNIRGIIDPGTGLPPSAQQIADAVTRLGQQQAKANPGAFPKGIGTITFTPDAGLQKTVQSFGILDETKARQELGYKGDFPTLEGAIGDFIKEVISSPGRFKKLELY